MASFYRKWRPQKFSDLVGQNHIKKTLTSAVASGKISHAYLFAGPRGTGKTSTARLLAKAVNCVLRKNGSEPCDRCVHCIEISAARSLDVIEIDAASTRGIDDIRELREKIKFAPNKSKYKVFIVDEVHMLTEPAFNALLKTLEEPPPHAIFILATTEAHKIPYTILSRCQRFDFKKASVKDILAYLGKIVKGEKIKIAPGAIRLIANLADGSYRDAVSILDQVASVSSQEISLKDVQDILGIAQEKYVTTLIENLVKGNLARSIDLIRKVYEDGYDLLHFCQSIVGYFRRALLFLMDNQSAFSGMTEEQTQELKEISRNLDRKQTILMLENFRRAQREIKVSEFPQLPLEMAILELFEQEILTERKESVTDSEKAEKDKEKKQSNYETAADSANSLSQDYKVKLIKDKWENIQNKLKDYNHSLAALLRDAYPIGFENGKLNIAVRYKFHAEVMSNNKNSTIIEEAIAEETGQKCTLACQIKQIKTAAKKEENPEQELIEDAIDVFGKDDKK